MKKIDPRAAGWMEDYLRKGCTVREAATWVTQAEGEHKTHSPAYHRRIAELVAAYQD